MTKITVLIVAVLVLLALAATVGKEITGLDCENEVTETIQAPQTLSSDPEWGYEAARKDGQIVILDY